MATGVTLPLSRRLLCVPARCMFAAALHRAPAHAAHAERATAATLGRSARACVAHVRSHGIRRNAALQRVPCAAIRMLRIKRAIAAS